MKEEEEEEEGVGKKEDEDTEAFFSVQRGHSELLFLLMV